MSIVRRCSTLLHASTACSHSLRCVSEVLAPVQLAQKCLPLAGPHFRLFKYAAFHKAEPPVQFSSEPNTFKAKNDGGLKTVAAGGPSSRLNDRPSAISARDHWHAACNTSYDAPSKAAGFLSCACTDVIIARRARCRFLSLKRNMEPPPPQYESSVPPAGVRVPCTTEAALPQEQEFGSPACVDLDGSPVWIGSALVDGGRAVHPCKVVKRGKNVEVMVSYGGKLASPADGVAHR